jgi:copper homeostasis protein
MGNFSQTPLLEICCTSLDDALAATRGGADRIELCEELWMGGVTPDEDLIGAVLSAVSIPVFVLVRSRGGDFVYDADEVAEMVDSISIARELGVAGIVCGALTADGEIDIAAAARMIVAARPLPFTFHRAFDVCADRERALLDLRELGVDRVLSSDGQERAADAPERMRRLAESAGDAPLVQCCGGVRSGNVARLAEIAELREFHSAARVGGGGVDQGEVEVLRAAFA